MKHPAYHLRINKAVDRLALIEAVGRLAKLDEGVDASAYTYYGFGGPCLEEFRLLYELFPTMKMVSIERSHETHKRQQFHLPCATMRLERADFEAFLSHYEPKDERSIFWLDFTGLEYSHIDSFMTLLGKVAASSMVKITLQAEPTYYTGKGEVFRNKFAALMPDPTRDPPWQFRDFACLVQDMLQVAAERALPAGVPNTFQPVSSFYYSDGTGMLTLTGIVCFREERALVRRAFRDWQFKNLDWSSPKRIDVPLLSTKERLHLECRLPCSGHAGRTLRQALGYLIDDDTQTTEKKLKQYSDFHRLYPYFVRVLP